MELKTKDAPAMTLLTASKTIKDAGSEIPPFAGEVLPKIVAKAKEMGLRTTEPEMFIYTFQQGGTMNLVLGVPVREAKGESGEFKFIATQPVRCVSTSYKGSMLGIKQAWDAFIEATNRQKLEFAAENREVYLKWVDFDSAENETELQRVLK